MMRFLILFIFLNVAALAQFAPPQGQAGSSAMYKDSSVFVAWASSCKIKRGLQDTASAASGYASVGDSSSALGIADGSVVSLGDGGTALCTFAHPIKDGAGYDFAVFENSFDGKFLELGFVEVSSDGLHFFRFPATSNTQDSVQTASFGDSDASKINNLAGKYVILYGTPFDLSEMQNIPGLDINYITHVKIIDVVGSINPSYTTYDKNGNKINDPYPTPFASGGFDLDAIGVIHSQASTSIQQIMDNEQVLIYPNPSINTLYIDTQIPNESTLQYALYNDLGVKLQNGFLNSAHQAINTRCLNSGFYFLQIKGNDFSLTKKICINHE
ncbi:MAG: T9SS type A sorting domain-containing protein [Bacteroidetes bacterium]|nr:T9SS type A sorting domain-containing protein [Bacteroidota bacterium]